MSFATPADIEHAASALKRGELVALPTETVYGLGADALNDFAVARIFAAKGRPADHPLIVHLAGATTLSTFAREVPRAAVALAERFWPGPLTLILQRADRVPLAVTGGQDTVGIRCPSHPIAQALLLAFAKIGSGAIAAPSANRFGHVSPTTAQHVRDEFGKEIGRSITLLDGGACHVGIESTILDLSRGVPVLLRPGAITRTEIAEVIGTMPLTGDEDRARQQAGVGKSFQPQTQTQAPRVSGALAAHYAPKTPLRVVKTDVLTHAVDEELSQGKRVAVLALSAKPRLKPSPVGVGVRKARPLVWVNAGSDAVGYAQSLYANLRTLDAAATAVILVEAPPTTVPWEAVNDRLSRAATGSGMHRSAHP
jgi:L-threonylcarbamoyladenylate synthase